MRAEKLAGALMLLGVGVLLIHSARDGLVWTLRDELRSALAGACCGGCKMGAP